MSYYILFANYTQGMMLQDLLRGEGFSPRISPTPRSIQGELGCGMSLLIKEEEIEEVRKTLDRLKPEYHSIVELENQINPNRNRYC